MVILFFGSFHDKKAIYPPTHNPRTWFFVTVIYIVNIFYVLRDVVNNFVLSLPFSWPLPLRKCLFIENDKRDPLFSAK